MTDAVQVRLRAQRDTREKALRALYERNSAIYLELQDTWGEKDREELENEMRENIRRIETIERLEEE